MKKFPLALLFVASVAGADTQTITNKGCKIDVPKAWKADPTGAVSADRKASVTVSSPKMIDSFDELKTTAKSIYKDTKVTKESATELELEGKSLNGRPNVYRAIDTGAKHFCVVEVIYSAGSADDMRAIAHSVAAAK